MSFQVKSLDIQTLINEKVRVYKNLHNGFMSVQSYQRGKGWRLAGHTKNLFLADCVFLVYEKGRQRVIAQKQKIVHAYIQGIVANSWLFSSDIKQLKPVSYNPYFLDSFYLVENQTPIKFTKYCLIKQNKVFAMT